MCVRARSGIVRPGIVRARYYTGTVLYGPGIIWVRSGIMHYTGTVRCYAGTVLYGWRCSRARAPLCYIRRADTFKRVAETRPRLANVVGKGRFSLVDFLPEV